MTGGGDVDYLVRLGALADNWVLIHSIWLTPQRDRPRRPLRRELCHESGQQRVLAATGSRRCTAMFEAG